MILDVFPSYKDKDMVDSLYQFERATGRSLNILVEKYLEKLLYENGYFTIENEMENEVSEETKFSTRMQNGKIRLFYGDFDFSSHNPEYIEEIITQLSNIPEEELKSLSANVWQDNIRTYKPFLYSKLNLNHLLPKKVLNDTQWITLDKRYGTYRVSKNNIHFGSHDTLEKAKEVREFLIENNWDIKYSSKVKGMKGKKYKEWLYSEMKKKQNMIMEDN